MRLLNELPDPFKQSLHQHPGRLRVPQRPLPRPPQLPLLLPPLRRHPQDHEQLLNAPDGEEVGVAPARAQRHVLLLLPVAARDLHPAALHVEPPSRGRLVLAPCVRERATVAQLEQHPLEEVRQPLPRLPPVVDFDPQLLWLPWLLPLPLLLPHGPRSCSPVVVLLLAWRLLLPVAPHLSHPAAPLAGLLVLFVAPVHGKDRPFLHLPSAVLASGFPLADLPRPVEVPEFVPLLYKGSLSPLVLLWPQRSLRCRLMAGELCVYVGPDQLATGFAGL